MKLQRWTRLPLPLALMAGGAMPAAADVTTYRMSTLVRPSAIGKATGIVLG